MTEEERLIKEWPIFYWELDAEQNTDAETLDSARNSTIANPADTAAVSEGGKSASAGEGTGISGDAGGANAGNSASAGTGIGAGTGGVGM